jgi:hypothetical protein
VKKPTAAEPAAVQPASGRRYDQRSCGASIAMFIDTLDHLRRMADGNEK